MHCHSGYARERVQSLSFTRSLATTSDSSLLWLFHFSLGVAVFGHWIGEFVIVSTWSVLYHQGEYRRLGLSAACASWDNSNSMCAT